MSKKTHLKIMTPRGLFLEDDVEIVTVKTTEGYIGLQADKSPLIGAIEISEMIIGKFSSPKHQVFAISNGLVYVTKTNVDIVAESVEAKEQIDLNRAKQAKVDAEERLKQDLSKAELLQTSIELKKALNRIKVKEET